MLGSRFQKEFPAGSDKKAPVWCWLVTPVLKNTEGTLSHSSPHVGASDLQAKSPVWVLVAIENRRIMVGFSLCFCLYTSRGHSFRDSIPEVLACFKRYRPVRQDLQIQPKKTRKRKNTVKGFIWPRFQHLIESYSHQETRSDRGQSRSMEVESCDRVIDRINECSGKVAKNPTERS